MSVGSIGRVTQLLAVVLLVCVPSLASGAPLRLGEVLDALGQTHPELEAADRKIDEAAGKEMAAKGGFDPKLAIRSKWTPVGYYNNGQVDTLVRQATPAWGIGAYAGYRVGFGSYPIYKGELQTLSGGEVRAGIDVPVWRDGPIDARRAKIKQAKIRRRGAGQKRSAAQLKLEQAAAKAYWNWVAAGLRLKVARDLLGIAQRREGGLQRQADAGAIERIKLVDNRRLVLDRKAKVVAADQKFKAAALKLSLFLRDEDLNPIRAEEERVPPGIRVPRRIDVASPEREVTEALRRRPDVAALDAEREASKVDVRLARNQRAPAVNLQTFIAKDFGAGPVELGPTEWGAGVVVELPIPMRKARGDYRAAKASLAGVDAQRRGLRDKVGMEIRDALVALRAAEQSAELASQQVLAADELANAERTKFTEGASDLVIVNIRELAAADAATQKIDVLAEYQRAHAQFMTATGRSPTR